MSHDTPADPPPWQQGPPPGYVPPETPSDPDLVADARAACIAAIEAATGKTKTPDGRWVERDTTNEGARP